MRPNMFQLVVTVLSLVSMSSTLPAYSDYSHGNPEAPYSTQGNGIKSPFVNLGDNIGKAVESKAKSKVLTIPFPDSGKTRAVLEQKNLESVPIKLDNKYGGLQNFVAGLHDPKPVVDTIQEYEKYGNDGEKFRQIGTVVVGGYEALSNILNAAVELPFTIFKQFGRKITTSLNTVGGKLVGLS